MTPVDERTLSDSIEFIISKLCDADWRAKYGWSNRSPTIAELAKLNAH